KHGVFNCTFEHPELAQLKEEPRIDRADLERAEFALKVKERPENSPKCQLYNHRIQFASEDVVKKMGVDIDIVRRGEDVGIEMEDTVSAPGVITYAQPLVSPL